MNRWIEPGRRNAAREESRTTLMPKSQIIRVWWEALRAVEERKNQSVGRMEPQPSEARQMRRLTGVPRVDSSAPHPAWRSAAITTDSPGTFTDARTHASLALP